MGETREWFEDRTIQDVNCKRCGTIRAITAPNEPTCGSKPC